MIFRSSGYNRPNQYLLYVTQADILNKDEGHRAALPVPPVITSKFIMRERDSLRSPFAILLDQLLQSADTGKNMSVINHWAKATIN